jgi:VanZ family protein
MKSGAERFRMAVRGVFFAAAGFALVMALLPKPPALPLDPGDKVMHMLAFATLGALAALGWHRTPLLWLFGALAAFGGFIEIAQAIPMLHRDAQWSDWFADMAAALVALAVVRTALRTR